MRYCVIAARYKQAGIDYVKVINETGSMQNLHLSRVINFIEHGIEFSNIGINDMGKLAWTQGDYSRYSYRLNGKEYNKNAVVVVGYQIFNGETIYTVSDRSGNRMFIKSEGIQQLAKEYTIANCRIENRDGVDYLVSLGRELDEMTAEPEFRFDKDTHKLIVKLAKATERLIIPEEVEGDTINNISWIDVEPENNNYVTYLELPSTLKEFNRNITSNLKNLKELNILGDIHNIERGKSTRWESNIEKIHFKSVSHNIELFNGLTNLKEVTFDKQPAVYKTMQFIGCNKLDYSNLFNEGLVGIDKAYINYCGKKELVLPKSLKWLDIDAFQGCDKIERVIMRGNTAILDEYGYVIKPLKNRLFKGKNKITLRCPYNYPIKYIASRVANNITIEREESPDGDRTNFYKQRLMKAKLLGMNVVVDDVACGITQVSSAIKLMDHEAFREQLIECINANVIAGNLSDKKKFIIGKDGLFILAGLHNYEIKELKKAYLGKKYAVLIGKNITYIIPIDADIILKYLEVNSQLYYSEESKFILIPQDYMRVSYKNIKDIYEEGDSLVIKCTTYTKTVNIDSLY